MVVEASLFTEPGGLQSTGLQRARQGGTTEPAHACVHTHTQSLDHSGGGLVAKLYLTLCNPMDCSLPGSSVQGISQAGVLERVPIPFSGDLPKPRIKPASSALQADSLPMSHLGSPFYE